MFAWCGKCSVSSLSRNVIAVALLNSLALAGQLQRSLARCEGVELQVAPPITLAGAVTVTYPPWLTLVATS